jgi:hypothetical protein
MSQYRQSGKDGPAKAAIVEYVGRSTSEGHGFVGPAYLARSATVEDLKVLEPEPFSADGVPFSGPATVRHWLVGDRSLA